MRVDKATAVVLHSRPWRESSQLLDVFSAEYGRVSLVGRGSRNGRKGKIALAPFTLYSLDWSGQSELKTLRESEIQIQWQLPGERALCGLYLNELLCRLLLNEDPHPRLFACYLQTCEAFDRGGEDAGALLRRFELQLLEELGYSFMTDELVSEPGFDEASRYSYASGEGWRLDSLRGMLGSTLVDLGGGKLPDTAEEKGRLRYQLRCQIDELLNGRPIQSRDLLMQYRAKKG